MKDHYYINNIRTHLLVLIIGDAKIVAKSSKYFGLKNDCSVKGKGNILILLVKPATSKVKSSKKGFIFY